MGKNWCKGAWIEVESVKMMRIGGESYRLEGIVTEFELE
jgi:hypothetical protein